MKRAATEKERDEIKAQVATLTKELEEARQLRGEAEAQVAVLTRERDESRHKEVQYARKTRDLIWRGEELAAQVDRQMREIAILRERSASSQDEIATLKRQIGDFTTQARRGFHEISRLQEKLSGRVQRVTELERIVEDITAIAEDQAERGRAVALEMREIAARTLVERDKRIEELVEEAGKSKATERRQADEMKELIGKLSDAERMVEQYRRKAEQVSDEMAQLKADLQTVNCPENGSAEQMAEHKDAIAALNDAMKDLMDERDTAVAQRDKEIRVATQLSIENAEYDALLDIKTEEIVALTQFLQEKESKISDLSNIINNYKIG